MVEVVQGEVIEKVATRDYVGEQIALVRKDLTEQIGSVRQEIGSVRQELTEQISAARADAAREASLIRQELIEQIGAVRQELARHSGETRTELMPAINRLTFWMNGFLAALLVAVLGLSGILIAKL